MFGDLRDHLKRLMNEVERLAWGGETAEGSGCRLKEGVLGIELVDDHRAFKEYCCVVRRNKEGTNMKRLQAVNLYHEQ